MATTAPGVRLIVYGSYARGVYREDSDIDLIVLLDTEKISYEQEKSITYPLYDIKFDTGVLISPMVYPQKTWETKYKVTPFYKNVIREGILL